MTYPKKLYSSKKLLCNINHMFVTCQKISLKRASLTYAGIILFFTKIGFNVLYTIFTIIWVKLD